MTCRSEFKAGAPLLVVVPAAALEFWEGEWALWAASAAETSPDSSSSTAPQQQQQPFDMVVYSGSAAARSIIQDFELWQDPAALDSKAKVCLRCVQGTAREPVAWVGDW
jgi:hypothetical protein